jgi:hypothetical protein
LAVATRRAVLRPDDALGDYFLGGRNRRVDSLLPLVTAIFEGNRPVTFPMVFRWRPAQCLAAAIILLLGPALSSMASGQEAMQLDLEFRNSLLRGQALPEQVERRRLRQQPIEASTRHPKRRRHEKASSSIR